MPARPTRATATAGCRKAFALAHPCPRHARPGQGPRMPPHATLASPLTTNAPRDQRPPINIGAVAAACRVPTENPRRRPRASPLIRRALPACLPLAASSASGQRSRPAQRMPPLPRPPARPERADERARESRRTRHTIALEPSHHARPPFRSHTQCAFDAEMPPTKALPPVP